MEGCLLCDQYAREAAQFAAEANSPNAPIILNGVTFRRVHES
jgi:hypothetical protein